MKWLLIGCILLYRLLNRTTGLWRRTCVFRTSCSLHVYAVTRAEGLSAGLRAFRDRRRQCRPGYHYFEGSDARPYIVLADGTAIPYASASDSVQAQYIQEAWRRTHETACAPGRCSTSRFRNESPDSQQRSSPRISLARHIAAQSTQSQREISQA